MEFSDEQTFRLLGAIETDSLMFLCGAGLSIPSPSNLLPAAEISKRCYDRWVATEPLDPALKHDIERLANHFHARNDFKIFHGLIPWNDLVGTPNKGHAAIADLLITRGARAALSANIDCLIESWAQDLKFDMRGALTGQEASTFNTTNPLIKFHGCLRLDRENTVWTHGQLAQSPVIERVSTCSSWMNLNLPDKHLVVVGFWTDWRYLNDVIANAFEINNARCVTIIDPSPANDLQTKAPNLWAKLTSLSNRFEHVQASGADALDDLRTAYSRAWTKKFYALGRPLIEATGGPLPPAATPDGLTGEDLYNLRRDAEGVPYNRAATCKAPAQHAAQAARIHMILLNAGAIKQGSWLQHGGKSIRIVNGAGRWLAQVREEYKEPAVIPQSDIVVCAAADDLGVPARLIPSGRGASMIRPSSGGGARWLTLEQARVELNV
jgi:hypothetical protein